MLMEMVPNTVRYHTQHKNQASEFKSALGATGDTGATGNTGARGATSGGAIVIVPAK